LANISSPLLASLSNLMIALICFTSLLAAFQFVTAFLHFYLFFALSVPYTYLVDAQNVRNLKPNGAKEEKVDSAQVEVDLRVRCERPPFESYLWVWWAWWAHRRSPLGAFYAALVILLAIITVGLL